MDSVAFLEPASPERPWSVCPDGFVYNLEVEHNHNYFAGGFLVHNCHHATAPEWRKQIETCKGVRWGFTATPWGRDAKRNAQLREMFGNNVYVIEREEVGQNLAPARVVWLDACDEGLPERIQFATEKLLAERMGFQRYRRMPKQQAWGECAWQVCCDAGITSNQARTAEVVRLMNDHRKEGGVLVLTNHVEHAQWLASRVTDATAVYAALPVKSRRHIIGGFKAGIVPILVAISLADEGFDAPVAQTLILASGGRNEARTIQRTGRVLRPHPGKTEAVIYDFKDSAIPLMHRHAQKRAQIYNKLGYSGDYSWI